MDSIIKYDEKNGIICASYDDILCNVIEIDVTDQALQAVFRYLMAHGLSLAEHCEYEVDGNKFRTSLVKEEPTIDPVKHGKWFIDDDFDSPNFGRYKCSECGEWNHDNYNYCPDCGAKMDGDSNG